MKKEDLKKLYHAGLISSKPFRYLELKGKVSQYMVQGITKTEAVQKTAAIARTSTTTVWNALNATKGINLS